MNGGNLLQRHRVAAFLLWVLVLAFMFAEVEIQIEGATGWAGNLPTWRIEQHWLLDLLWGGRPMTGYHAWVFSFMALVFHLPMFFAERWDWRLELRVLGGLMLFWIAEDFLWFAFNPAYGLEKFAPASIPWHKHWWLGVPTDYVTFSATGAILIALSGWPGRRLRPT
jgi:hypothetical protein